MFTHINNNRDYDTIQNIYPRINMYTATWCGPCKMITSQLEELMKNGNIPRTLKFYKIDIDLVETPYNIHSVPTFYFFKNVLLKPTIVKGADIDKVMEQINSLN